MDSNEVYRLYRKLKVDYQCLELQFKILENKVRRTEWENLIIAILASILTLTIWCK